MSVTEAYFQFFRKYSKASAGDYAMQSIDEVFMGAFLVPIKVFTERRMKDPNWSVGFLVIGNNDDGIKLLKDQKNISG